MLTGTLIAWNPELKRGLVEDNLHNEVYHFFGSIDELALPEAIGIPVVFELADVVGFVCSVELASASFARYCQQESSIWREDTKEITSFGWETTEEMIMRNKEE